LFIKVYSNPTTASDEDVNDLLRYFDVIVFIRGLKLFIFFYELKEMRIIFETIMNLIGPIS